MSPLGLKRHLHFACFVKLLLKKQIEVIMRKSSISVIVCSYFSNYRLLDKCNNLVNRTHCWVL